MPHSVDPTQPRVLQRTPGGRLAAVSDSALQLLHDPSRIVRWIYMGRLSLAIAIFIAAVYILVIAYASLVLPSGRGLLVAALAIVLYFADVVWGHPGDPTLSVWL